MTNHLHTKHLQAPTQLGGRFSQTAVTPKSHVLLRSGSVRRRRSAVLSSNSKASPHLSPTCPPWRLRGPWRPLCGQALSRASVRRGTGRWPWRRSINAEKQELRITGCRVMPMGISYYLTPYLPFTSHSCCLEGHSRKPTCSVCQVLHHLHLVRSRPDPNGLSTNRGIQ